MVEEDRSVFSSTLAQVCSDMFRECAGFSELAEDDQRAPSATGPDTIVASIGLAGVDFRGALVIHAPPAFFQRSYPASLKRTVISDAQMIDWAGEISNQLLGRLKNRLCQFGLDFAISTPTVVRGDKLVLNAAIPSSVQHGLRVGEARADIVLNVAHDSGGPLLPASGQPQVASLEGEALLF
jgi:CheY-specific phosphatase CheX